MNISLVAKYSVSKINLGYFCLGEVISQSNYDHNLAALKKKFCLCMCNSIPVILATCRLNNWAVKERLKKLREL